MAKYKVTSPDGQVFEIEAPENATQEQIMAYAQQQFAQAGTAPPAGSPPKEQRAYNAMTDYRSPTAPITRSFQQGITFGFGDELGAGIRAAVVSPFSKRTFGEVYDTEVGKIRGEMAQETEGAPVRSFIGGAAGSLLPTAKLAGGVTTFAKNVPNWIKLAGMGGAEGALFGAGSADDGSRLESAAAGGTLGAVASPLVATMARPVLTGMRNAASGVVRGLTSTPKSQAERLVADSLRGDLADPETAKLLQRLPQSDPMVLADVGENLTGLARGAQSKPGPFRAMVHDLLPTRQAGQQGRLIASMGVRGPQTFKDSFDDWAESRITAARAKYDEAYAAHFDASSPQMKALLQKPAMQRALREAERKIANESGIKGGNVQRLDAAKRSLDDQIGVALRAGKNDEVRILTNIKRELVSEMDRQVPAYAEARSIFAGEAAVREAADFGTDLFKRNTSHDEARRLVADMTESELEAFRRGALRGLVEQLETTAENRNVASKLIESTAVRDKLRLLFPNADDFGGFVQRAADEARMTYTRNAVLGGSPTARIQEETRDLVQAGQMMSDLAGGDHGRLIARFLRGLGFGDTSPEVLSELGELLLKPQSPQRVDQLLRMANRPAPGAVSPMTRTIAGGSTAAGLGVLAGQDAQEQRRRKYLDALLAGPDELLLP